VKVAGERDFEAPREAVWRVLNDPAAMAATMPGVESFDVHDDRHWRANVKIPLGLGTLGMTMDMEKTEEREPEFARLAIKGNGVGAIMSMTTAFNLSDDGGRTKMDWEADVRIAGPVGSMGQRVLQPIVNQQVQHVLAALEEQVRKAQADGSFRDSVTPEFAAMAFYGAIEQVLTGWIFGLLEQEDDDYERAKSFVVGTICDGLEAHPDGARA